MYEKKKNFEIFVKGFKVLLTADRGIEPLFPPWEGGVLTAWPISHVTFCILYHICGTLLYYNTLRKIASTFFQIFPVFLILFIFRLLPKLSDNSAMQTSVLNHPFSVKWHKIHLSTGGYGRQCGSGHACRRQQGRWKFRQAIRRNRNGSARRIPGTAASGF